MRKSARLRVQGGVWHFFHMLVLFCRVELDKFTSFDRLSKFHVVFEILRFSCVNFRRFRGQKWPFLDGFRAIKWKVLHENTWNLVETCIWCCWEWKISFSLLLEEKCQKIAIFRFFWPFFTKTPVSQNNVWVFSRKTGRDRKLKFGMDDPCYMFLKVGDAFVDICFSFWVMLDYVPI